MPWKSRWKTAQRLELGWKTGQRVGIVAEEAQPAGGVCPGPINYGPRLDPNCGVEMAQRMSVLGMAPPAASIWWPRGKKEACRKGRQSGGWSSWPPGGSRTPSGNATLLGLCLGSFLRGG